MAKAQKDKDTDSKDTEEKALRSLNNTIYAKKRDLSKLKTEVIEQLDSKTRKIKKNLSRLEQAQTRLIGKLDQRSRMLRNALIIVVILVIILIGMSIWFAISICNLLSESNNQLKSFKGDLTSYTIEPAHDINLSEKDADLILTEGGDYFLTGKSAYPININTDDDVTLHLANVKIATANDTAISYNNPKGALHVDLIKNTKNVLSSNGTGANGGTLHSSGVLEINGEGSLETYGQQLYGNGITTNQRFDINGGEVLSIGSDMIEKPVFFNQQCLSFDLDNIVNSGSTVQIRNQHGTVLRSLIATQNFRTLIWSKPKLNKGTYSLFVDDQKIKTLTL